MATLVRLTQKQVDHLFDEAILLERELKDMHEELIAISAPRETLVRFSKLHDRFTAAVTFIRRQRELGGPLPSSESTPD